MQTTSSTGHAPRGTGVTPASTETPRPGPCTWRRILGGGSGQSSCGWSPWLWARTPGEAPQAWLRRRPVGGGAKRASTSQVGRWELRGRNPREAGVGRWADLQQVPGAPTMGSNLRRVPVLGREDPPAEALMGPGSQDPSRTEPALLALGSEGGCTQGIWRPLPRCRCHHCDAEAGAGGRMRCRVSRAPACCSDQPSVVQTEAAAQAAKHTAGSWSLHLRRVRTAAPA